MYLRDQLEMNTALGTFTFHSEDIQIPQSLKQAPQPNPCIYQPYNLVAVLLCSKDFISFLKALPYFTQFKNYYLFPSKTPDPDF